jgi:hypothetical protein
VEAALAEPRCFPLKTKSHRLTPPKSGPTAHQRLNAGRKHQGTMTTQQSTPTHTPTLPQPPPSTHERPLTTPWQWRVVHEGGSGAEQHSNTAQHTTHNTAQQQKKTQRARSPSGQGRLQGRWEMGATDWLTCRSARAVLWRRPADPAVLARQACSSYSPFLCLAAPGLSLHNQPNTGVVLVSIRFPGQVASLRN